MFSTGWQRRGQARQRLELLGSERFDSGVTHFCVLDQRPNLARKPGDKVIVEGRTFLATIQCFRLSGAELANVCNEAAIAAGRRIPHARGSGRFAPPMTSLKNTPSLARTWA